jgi:V8-like Glu-specific endopeptidase
METDPYELKKASGFFYCNLKNKQFLITNRHVIINEDEKHFPNILRIRIHTDRSDLRQNEYYDIHLYTKSKKNWIEPSSPADVIAIPVESVQLPRTSFITYFNKVNLLPSNIQLHVGEDLFVMGYPLGVYDDIYNLPIVRNGLIASAYSVPYSNEAYFLVDSYLEEGASGSPVMTKFKSAWKTKDGTEPPKGFSFYLLGIISSTFRVPEGQIPIGLNASYFAEIIENMVTNA